MTNLTNDQKSADLARSTAADLLEAADAAIVHGVSVPVDKERVFGPVYSWWRLVCRTSEAVLLLTERGFTLEAAPIVRNILNHAYAINWLVDNGDLAVDALVARGDDEREKLCKKLEETGWSNAAEFRAVIDQATAQQVPAVRTPAEQTLFNKLKHELGNFYDMLDRYDVGDIYPVYSHLSSLSHTTIATASAYVEQMSDGSLQIRPEAADLGHADIIQLALALLQTATVVSPLIDGDPLRASIDQATADLGLENTQLLPVRVK
ncbi:DUF5677 domain-containing protein [Streptomyces sp. NBC_01622]|uniref:DUF5677 domain-containing protein n=1 Tax=Streptomyces sp. NBC_01622 TaxID=2975903 RepID=UPI003865FC36|nr:DUF5677 domain-containing protein [Streptomyces sp. NBC_01622]WTE48686.1 DUF5677 domain-containing protein [Streptomyces sp. NBC_01622]